MLSWLIIGGGIHGIHLAHLLVRNRNAKRDALRILDPNEQPAANWNRLTANTGMTHLRSPGVHHVGIHPSDLSDFAKYKKGLPLPYFAQPYHRPSLALFQAHIDYILHDSNLKSYWLTGYANGLDRIRGGWRIETGNGSIETQRVILAIGRSTPFWPDWALGLLSQGGEVAHIFDSGFFLDSSPNWSRLVIVGGGITAAQVAIKLSGHQPGTVTVLSRHPVKKHQFDSDPGWLGPKYLDSFCETASFTQRRALIATARHRGSIPESIAHQLNFLTRRGQLSFRVDQVVGASVDQSGAIALRLASGDYLATDRIILATGFNTKRPGGDWVDRTVAQHGLSIAPCGFPIVDRSLCWQEGLYVSGSLAELEIGPIAPNIAGARHAAKRILG